MRFLALSTLLLWRNVGAELEAETRPPGLHKSVHADNNKHRYLPSFDQYISGDTTGAALSSGNSAGSCSTLTACINGCRSHFYKLTSNGNPAFVTDSTCGTGTFDQRIYVWQGSGSVCSTFTCKGTCVRVRRRY
jgi:hypothetical protein